MDYEEEKAKEIIEKILTKQRITPEKFVEKKIEDQALKIRSDLCKKAENKIIEILENSDISYSEGVSILERVKFKILLKTGE